MSIPVTELGGDSPITDCIFQEAWWLDAVAPGSWGEVTVEDGGRTIGRLPFMVKKRFGLQVLSMPRLTQTLGPVYRIEDGPTSHRLAREIELVGELTAKLPRYDRFYQSFTPAIDNWYPFYLCGFQQSTRYTYRFESLTDLDRIHAGFNPNVRRAIRKAEGLLEVRQDLGIDRLIDVVEQTYARQGGRFTVPRDLIHRLDAAAVSRGASLPLFAVDREGRIHAVAYVVHDSRCAYWLLAGSDPAHRDSGAGTLLVWRALQLSAERSRAFDFEGSMIAPIAAFYRRFGARQTAYSAVWAESRRFRLLRLGRELWSTGIRGSRPPADE